MKLSSQSFEPDAPMPARCAFGAPDPETHVTFSGNRNPHLAWSDVPEGTKSFAVVCVDPDAPTKPDDVNKEGRTVPRSLPRADFHHWGLVDLSADVTEIEEGEFAADVVPKGKEGPGSAKGTRAAINDYTSWFAGDSDMEGQYYGYDGPCPPWNDELVHRYVFRVFALDVARAPVDGSFTVPDVLEAIAPHVLAEASITGTYKIYADAT